MTPNRLLLTTFLASACHSFTWKSDETDTAKPPGLELEDTGDDGADTGGGDADTDDSGDPDDPPPAPPLLCDTLIPEITGNTFYVDPIGGSDEGDGSRLSPWASLQLVVDTQVDCTDADGTAHHSSAPVQGGDAIVLLGTEGHESSLNILGCFNSDYVSIIAEQRHAPELGYLSVKGGAYWHFEGLSMMSQSGGQMMKLTTHSTRGPVHHVRIHDNLFTSGALHSRDDYMDKATDAVLLSQVDDALVSCNEMSHIAQGVTASGDRIDVLYNQIRFFSEDALVNGGSENRYIGNTVLNTIKDGSSHHDDFFQSHRGIYPDTSSDVEISYNTFMNLYPETQDPDTMGPTQCIGAFEEGEKTGWKIFNNICKGDHYHGITLKEISDSLIVNNTIVGGGDLPGVTWDTPDLTWVNVSGGDNIIRNNLGTNFLSGGDHNLTVTVDNVYEIFVDWDGNDLRLRADSSAVNAGSAEDAPADDLDGEPRDGTPDLGAYELAPAP